MTVFALADCNNFYASCERIFNPKLKGIPLAVLANNDGVAVAMSNEAKALGIKIGTPFYTLQALGVTVLSSNYTLYADISQRVMATLADFSPRMEIYSIDEAFLDLGRFRGIDLVDYGNQMIQTVLKNTGIPICVGMSRTKTLAKIANRYAKKHPETRGVFYLRENDQINRILEQTHASDIWGIGYRLSGLLKKKGIRNALQLKERGRVILEKKMGIVGTRLINELQGISCYPIEVSIPSKKGLTVSRTFPEDLSQYSQVRQALASYATRAAEKLRNGNLVAGVITVFLMTNRFRKDRPQYYNYSVTKLDVPTNSTPEILKYALKGLKTIFRYGYGYRKTGIMMDKVVPEKRIQQDFFDRVDRPRLSALMKSMDAINSKLGADTVKYAAAGIAEKPDWLVNRNMVSRSYTTRWDHLPVVR